MSSEKCKPIDTEILSSSSGSISFYNHVSQTQETANSYDLVNDDIVRDDDKDSTVAGPSVIGTDKIDSAIMHVDDKTADGVIVSSVSGSNNITATNQKTIIDANADSVTGLSVSGIKNSESEPEEMDRENNREISQCSQGGPVHLNSGNDDDDGDDDDSSVGSNENDIPHDLSPINLKNSNDEGNYDDDYSDDDSISSNESNIELLTNEVPDNIPSSDIHDISESNMRWMKIKIKSHADFLRYTTQWMLTMNIDKVSTLCTVVNKFEDSHFDTECFPYRTCTIKCAVCPSFSKGDRKPQCGVLVGYNMNKKDMFLSVKKLLLSFK